MNEWLTVREASEVLGVGRRTIFNYMRQGKLRAYKTGVGGRALLKRTEVEAFKTPRLRGASQEVQP